MTWKVNKNFNKNNMDYTLTTKSASRILMLIFLYPNTGPLREINGNQSLKNITFSSV